MTRAIAGTITFGNWRDNAGSTFAGEPGGRKEPEGSVEEREPRAELARATELLLRLARCETSTRTIDDRSRLIFRRLTPQMSSRDYPYRRLRESRERRLTSLVDPTGRSTKRRFDPIRGLRYPRSLFVAIDVIVMESRVEKDRSEFARETDRDRTRGKRELLPRTKPPSPITMNSSHVYSRRRAYIGKNAVASIESAS